MFQSSSLRTRPRLPVGGWVLSAVCAVLLVVLVFSLTLCKGVVAAGCICCRKAWTMWTSSCMDQFSRSSRLCLEEQNSTNSQGSCPASMIFQRRYCCFPYKLPPSIQYYIATLQTNHQSLAMHISVISQKLKQTIAVVKLICYLDQQQIASVQLSIFQFAASDTDYTSMSHPYYDFATLEEGSMKMIELIKECYSDTDKPVHPDPKPGFLRHVLPETAPEDGHTIEHLLERTKNAIVPGMMNWQAPNYFGYYPSSINVTSVLAEMFATTFQTPNFSYAVAPSFTELENAMVDWSAKALGLSQRFLLKNEGGGIINNSATESMFTSAHVAKFTKMKELKIEGNNPDVLKLVGYFGQGNHVASERGLAIKDIYYRRAIPYKYVEEKLNYELDYEKFVEIVEGDVKAGLIPFYYSGSWGNTFSAAIDINLRVVQLCKKYGMWVHVDAAFLGSTWICDKYRPKEPVLDLIDSICINFTKLLLNGTGGSLFYVANKRMVNESFGANALQFSFFKNHFTNDYDVVDYKDWIVGLARRNNSIKLYYTFLHYGLKRIRQSVLSNEEKANRLVEKIRAHPELFKIHAIQYSVVLFQVRDKHGEVSNDLTKSVALKIKNVKEGFCSPTGFRGTQVIRIVIGNFHTTDQHIDAYINRIILEARHQQSQ